MHYYCISIWEFFPVTSCNAQRGINYTYPHGEGPFFFAQDFISCHRPPQKPLFAHSHHFHPLPLASFHEHEKPRQYVCTTGDSLFKIELKGKVIFHDYGFSK